MIKSNIPNIEGQKPSQLENEDIEKILAKMLPEDRQKVLAEISQKRDAKKPKPQIIDQGGGFASNTELTSEQMINATENPLPADLKQAVKSDKEAVLAKLNAMLQGDEKVADWMQFNQDTLDASGKVGTENDSHLN